MALTDEEERQMDAHAAQVGGFERQMERITFKAITGILTDARNAMDDLMPVMVLTNGTQLVSKDQVKKVLQRIIDASIKYV